MRHLYKLFFLTVLFAPGCTTTEKDVAEEKVQVDQTDSTANVKHQKLAYALAYNKTLALWQVPFEERKIATSFGPAQVIISGPVDGEPLVLLHGMNASSTMWYPNIKAFSEQYRVYAIDFLLEPGKSMNEKEIGSTEQLIDWYYEIFEQLKLNEFSMVGASRGGWLAINIALRDSTRINKIALLSPAQAFIWIRPQSDIIQNVGYSLLPRRKRLRSVLKTMTTDVDKLDQKFIEQYFIATEESDMDNCILQMTPFSADQLKSLKMPVLVLIGDNDIINNEKSLETAKYIPLVETATINNAGHFLSFDQPEIINKKVLDFLKK
ncbi:MAG TPA: alpha/beta hydrolase [Bacteroidia bacterium]|jgi:pimeloyl-ACP methyl ester carboxylesterase